MPVWNDVTGIGIYPGNTEETYNHHSIYGIPDAKLQGYIEMTNIGRHIIDPLNPGFENTLQNMTHEFMHRWGAYPTYIDANGATSRALIGRDDAHWSYLLDSNGGVLYGNHWRDNGDGVL